MMEFISPNTKVNFIGMQKYWLMISLVTFLASVVLIFGKGFNYGIDFTGGAVIQVKFKSNVEASQVRKWLEQANIQFSLIQQLGDVTENEFQLKLQGNIENLQKLADTVDAALKNTSGENTFEIRKTDVVGPQAGSELRWNSIWATIYAILGIVLYVIVRFDIRYSLGALVATFHDAIFILGVFALTQQEFNLQIVAAVLTIIGYSINDTIIVYDRIRETIKNNPKRDLVENINESINSTLGRTINTSITTLLSSIALWVFGGGIIRDFAQALFIGIVVGTYSSIFVASPLFLWMARRMENVELRKKLA